MTPIDIEGLRALHDAWVRRRDSHHELLAAAGKDAARESAELVSEAHAALRCAVDDALPALLDLAERAQAAEADVAGLYADLNATALKCSALAEEIARLRAALTNLDNAIFCDPQVIDRAGEFRTIISDALEGRSAAQPAAERSKSGALGEVRVHLISEADTTGRQIKTACGKKGWQESGSEYTTAVGNIFEATQKLNDVTCRRCRQISALPAAAVERGEG